MKYTLSLALFLFLTLNTFSQIVNISGRCYYDVNGNHVFDGTDSVLANQQVQANYAGTTTYLANTDASGQYLITGAVGSYDINFIGNVAFSDYEVLYNQQKAYSTGGNYIVDFAYQQRDSITSVSAYIESLNNNNIPNTGATRQYNLRYGYDGLLRKIPATVTLFFNPALTVTNVLPAPTVVSSGKLQWNFTNVNRTLFNSTPGDSIRLTFNFPSVGDTIASFQLATKLVPGISVTTPYVTNYAYNFYQNIDFPLPQPIGATNGVKWLRHFAGVPLGYEYDELKSVDTTQNGNDYLIAGNWGYQPDPTVFGPSRPFIAKLNKDGLSIWEKYLDSLPGGFIYDWLTAIKHTPDGGCIVLGTLPIYDSTGYYTSKILVTKYDSTGTFSWGKTLSGSKFTDEAQDLSVLPDGSCLITGNSNSHDGDFLHTNADTVHSNLFVIKLSATGTTIFTKTFGGSRDDYGYRIQQLQNGSFLILGTTESNNGDVIGAHPHSIFEAYPTDTSFNQEAWILNINGSGNIIWSKCFGGSGASFIGGAIENNGGFLLTGATNSKDGDLPYYPESAVALWVLQISNTGNIASSKLHKLFRGYQDSNYITSPVEGLYDNNLASRLHKTRDGNFIVGGNISDRYGALAEKHGKSDFMIAKINPAGDIVWQKAIGGSGYETLSDIQVDKNEDIIFVGNSTSDNDDLYQHGNSYSQLLVVGKLGITNLITGQVYIDNNGNHVKDAGEKYFSQGRIRSVKRTDTIAAYIFNGSFLSNVDTGNYVSTYQAAHNYYTIFPTVHNSSFTSFGLKDSFDVALTPKPNINDLEIELLPMSTPRPGVDVTYRVITKNVGTTTMNNVVIGIKKDSRENYLNASRTESGILADSLWWGPFTLNAFDTDTLFVTFTLNTPPILNNGDTLSLTATANPVLNDSSVANNTLHIQQIVRGSFDPNDKTEIHAGTLTTTQYAGGEYLQYLVRFQNTGADTAFYITVKDTLQSKLDLNTLEIISASHPYTFSLNGNVASWDFKKILLPDSTTNEAGSHGFILFKVRPVAGLGVGDEFTNKAAIYFDYNLPVITNQDKTVIGNNAGICPNGNISFTAGLTGSTYQWQVNAGIGYSNVINSGIYNGANTNTLSLTSAPVGMYGYKYRCLVNGSNVGPESTLKFSVRWMGAVSSAWENPSNWNCGTAPNAQTDVIIPAGAVYPLVSSNAACYSLRLSPGSSVTVATGSSLIITGKPN